ncbi:methyltransferase [Xylogone sp. PMI_703]|nr:methyltransferase [Xylogone sp. PMI_703]
MAATIDPRANTGFSNAASYNAYRPSYPPAAVAELITHLNITGKSGARIVEVGAGTGKFTEALAARPEGFEIIAVEPQDDMRRELEAKKLKGVRVVKDSAASMTIEEGWADAVIVAQAFHWFATEESLRRIHSVLKPSGTLGLIWNVDDWNTPNEWSCATAAGRAVKAVNESIEDGLARFRHMKWKDVFTSTTPHLFKHPLQENRDTKWTKYLSDEAIWKRLATVSAIQNLTSEKRDEVKRLVFDALKGDEVERNENGEVVLHGLTYFAWTQKV